MRQGLLRTLANRMRGLNQRSRSDRRSRSTRFGFEIFSIELTRDKNEHYPAEKIDTSIKKRKW